MSGELSKSKEDAAGLEQQLDTLGRQHQNAINQVKRLKGGKELQGDEIGRLGDEIEQAKLIEARMREKMRGGSLMFHEYLLRRCLSRALSRALHRLGLLIMLNESCGVRWYVNWLMAIKAAHQQKSLQDVQAAELQAAQQAQLQCQLDAWQPKFDSLEAALEESQEELEREVAESRAARELWTK